MNPVTRGQSHPTQHAHDASQVLAARRRPAQVPAYEVLHAAAGATAAKLEHMRSQAQQALLQVLHPLPSPSFCVQGLVQRSHPVPLLTCLPCLWGDQVCIASRLSFCSGTFQSSCPGLQASLASQ